MLRRLKAHAKLTPSCCCAVMLKSNLEDGILMAQSPTTICSDRQYRKVTNIAMLTFML